jgi:hypothetical protein
MACSSFIIPKKLEEVGAGDIEVEQRGFSFWAPLRLLPKMLNTSEDAHVLNMSAFATYEHLRELMFVPAF